MVGNITCIYGAPMTRGGRIQYRKGIIFEELDLIVSRDVIRNRHPRDFVTYAMCDDNYVDA